MQLYCCLHTYNFRSCCDHFLLICFHFLGSHKPFVLLHFICLLLLICSLARSLASRTYLFLFLSHYRYKFIFLVFTHPWLYFCTLVCYTFYHCLFISLNLILMTNIMYDDDFMTSAVFHYKCTLSSFFPCNFTFFHLFLFHFVSHFPIS